MIMLVLVVFVYHVPQMIHMMGRVYMSHGRWLSLPGPHDTVDGIGDCPSIDSCSYGSGGPNMDADCLVMVWSLTL